MLFLFNDAIFDLGDPREFALEHALAEPLGPSAVMTLRAAQVVKMVREAIFDEPQLAHQPGPRRLPGCAGGLEN